MGHAQPSAAARTTHQLAGAAAELDKTVSRILNRPGDIPPHVQLALAMGTDHIQQGLFLATHELWGAAAELDKTISRVLNGPGDMTPQARLVAARHLIEVHKLIKDKILAMEDK